jgi:hypothetical protein
MFDSNLLFHNAAALTATGNSSGLDVSKTGHDGVWIDIAVTAVSGTSPTMDVKVQESDDNSTYNDLVTFAQITATGRYFRKVQSKKKYLRLARTVGGTTPSFTVTAGVVTGPERDAAA